MIRDEIQELHEQYIQLFSDVTTHEEMMTESQCDLMYKNLEKIYVLEATSIILRNEKAFIDEKYRLEGEIAQQTPQVHKMKLLRIRRRNKYAKYVDAIIGEDTLLEYERLFDERDEAILRRQEYLAAKNGSEDDEESGEEWPPEGSAENPYGTPPDGSAAPAEETPEEPAEEASVPKKRRLFEFLRRKKRGAVAPTAKEPAAPAEETPEEPAEETPAPKKRHLFGFLRRKKRGVTDPTATDPADEEQAP